MSVVAVLALAVSVGPVVALPAAGSSVVNPDTSLVDRGAVVEISVLDNDVLGDSPPDAPVTIGIGSAPTSGGATVVDPDGTGPVPPRIRYEAWVAAEVGPDVFDYSVSIAGEQVGTASVTVAVRNAGPVAVDDMAEVVSAPGATVTIPVLGNDSDLDGGPLTIQSVGSPEHGTAVPGEGLIAFDPVDDFVGMDEFEYTISDGQDGSATARVVVTVRDGTVPMVILPDSGSATAGVALVLDVLANDDSGGRDPLVIQSAGPSAAGASVVLAADGRSFTYTAPAGFSGTDTLSYVVADRRANVATGQVTVSVQAAPTPPVDPPVAPTPEPTPADPATPSKPKVAIEVSGPLTRADVRYSYRPGCPVKPGSLRRMSLNYWDYAGKVSRGTLIVRADVVGDLSHVFTVAFQRKFAIKKMMPADAYYKKGRRSPTASDRAAMAAGNTSAFNCRPVVGNPTKRSNHSYGVAIDINTFENPYVVGRGFYPRGAGKYLRRTPCRTGMICPSGPVVTAMRDRAWYWGARWSRPDYQHFSSNGG